MKTFWADWNGASNCGMPLLLNQLLDRILCIFSVNHGQLLREGFDDLE